MDIARANLIRDLKTNMGVNDAGLDVILHLIDHLHGLRKALAQRWPSCGSGRRVRGEAFVPANGSWPL